MSGIDESIKKAIKKDQTLPANSKFTVSTGKDHLVIMADQVKDLLVFQFCGIYRYLRVTDDASECVLFDDFKFINIGFITRDTSSQQGSSPRVSNDLI